MRLVHIVPSLEDRHGGPSKSVRALANSLAQAGQEVDLLSTDDAPAALSPGEPANIEVFPRAAPRWLTRSPALARRLQASTADVFHHHSLWLLTLRYTQEAATGRGVPYVISPRGMLSGWAYRHRRWRKALAEIFVHPGAFTHATGWHATSPAEADDIRRLGYRQPICVSPNGVVLPDRAQLEAARDHWLGLCPAARSRPVALFYSRFHRKKRLRELIELWLSAPRGDWLLLIAGLAEEYTATEVAGWIAAAGAGERIAVHDGAGHPPPYALASLFLLPSHSENFGLVIAEALAAGVPTLVTDTTPWPGLAANGCGWWVPWDRFGPALDQALAMTPAELRMMGSRGRAWVEKEFSWSRAAGLLLDFYRQLAPRHV
ncbi:MAG TPA: glycosyltransferase [Lacunisphaera sp.]|jgi:glycosyltransferase involved in cell wall biosynthesis|nr:glycosyltransferase [Lacunisphaera sp.]